MNPVRVGLSALGYHLPPDRRDVDRLHADGQTTSTPDKLRHLGFEAVRVAADGEGATELALRAVDDLVRRSGFDLQRIDLMIFGGGIGTSGIVEPGSDFRWHQARDPLPLFKFPGCRLQAELQLPRVPVLGVSQLACSAMHGAIRTARGLLAAEPELQHVLCVAADRFPPGCNREIVYNLMSDAGCAAVVSRDADRNVVDAVVQTTRGTYWDCEASHDTLIAGFFPLVRDTLVRAAQVAGVDVRELDVVVPHNVNRKSWEIVAEMTGLDPSRLYTDNIARFGHAVSGDNLVNHVDAVEAGRIRPGDRVAWFVTGFGAHWNCIVLTA